MTGTPPPFIPILLAQGYYVHWSSFAPLENDEASSPPNYFPTLYTWPGVNIDFDDPVTRYVQNIYGVVRGYAIYSGPNNTTRFYPLETSYKLTKLTIESCNTGEDAAGSCRGGQWKDTQYNNRYGGVFLYAEQTPQDKNPGEASSAGTLGGKVNGEDSGYIYSLAFDQSDFEFYTMNSGNSDGKFKNTFTNSAFKTTPVYENVMDGFGKHAPIYPMDAISKFIPDEREEIFVKYSVSLEATVDGNEVVLENGNISIVHSISQDDGNYNDKFRQLLGYCNYNNPGGFDYEQMSEGYPTDYPYTIISEFAPSMRSTHGEIDGNLKKGDLWYNPQTNKRYYYSVNDSPDELQVVDPGRSYSFLDNIVTSYIPTQDEKNNPREDVDIPYGVYVDITVDDMGRITTAKLSNNNYPHIANYRNGDMLAVAGGNGQGKLKVIMNNNTNRWTEKYIEEEL